jgi:hypothetical protein
MVEGQDRGGGGVVYVNERKAALARPNDRVRAVSDLLYEISVRRVGGARPIEEPISQDDAIDVLGLRDDSLKRGVRGNRAGQRLGSIEVQRRALVDDVRAHGGRHEGGALSDDSQRASFSGRVDEGGSDVAPQRDRSLQPVVKAAMPQRL